jgi:hypothetical protein
MENNPLTVTLYPNAFGMGYVISENPKEIINYGIAKIKPLTKDKYIKRLLRFIKYYKPTLILLRGYREADNRISKRITKVINAFEKEAEKLNLPVHKYSREDIKQVFSQFEGNTKYEISKTITSWYPELKRFMPDIRKNSKPEHYRMGIFDAFALMLTHNYLEE